jgi:hypothetical protein
MEYLFLNEIQKLIPLLDINIGEKNFDLHNDFNCTGISYNNKSLEFYFTRVIVSNSNLEKFASIIFSNIKETNYDDLRQRKLLGDLSTINNFSVGEITNMSVYYSVNEVTYYFLDFYEGDTIEIFCENAIIIFW